MSTSASALQARPGLDAVRSERPPNGAAAASPSAASTGPFIPRECETSQELGLPDAYIEALVFKHLLAVGSNTGRGMARDICVPGKPLVTLLTDLKNRQLLVYKGSASMGDFEYTLTESGRQRGNRYLEECAYSGAAPVPLTDYIRSIHAQSISKEHAGPVQLRESFRELLIDESILERLGPAINSGRGLFLYGAPGNGKTSIAERVTECFGSEIWIPKALYVDGETIQLHDPQCHVTVPVAKSAGTAGGGTDPRWIRIRRPTIVVGGELTMDVLELRYNNHTRVTEPPVQLKSNCGTLVIDDFGRQRINPTELLNRWIVPLEKRFDFLTLHNGKKIQVPFDQLIIFSTNLEPRDLVDDAFLRRIPYKIHVEDPTEEQFRELVRRTAEGFSMAYDETAVSHVIDIHYRAVNRRYRGCHPRDLLLQIIHRAKYRNEKPVMTSEHFDFACASYFAVF